MGAYLSEPIKDKEVESGESSNAMYSVAAMQGWRTEMEDAHLAALQIRGHPAMSMFGVFDGHGGKEVAKFVALHLVEELLKDESFLKGDFESSLRSTYLRMDEVMMEEGNQAELAALAGGRQDSEDIEFTDFENLELPDILKKAIQASAKDLGQQRQPFQFVKANQVNSFPISDLEELVDDGTDEDEELPDSQQAPVDCAEHENEVDGLHNSTPVCQEGNGSPAGLPHTMSIMKRGNGAAAGSGSGQDDNGNGAVLCEKLPTNGASSNACAEEASDGEVVEIDSPQTPDMAQQHEMVGGFVSELEALEAGESEGSNGPLAGCTAIVALVHNKRLIVANAGDSRCVLSRKGKAYPMSRDHKPTDPLEDERIRKAGGFVADGRVNGSLNLSRALGDMEYKKAKHLPPKEQMVTAFPDVKIMDLKRGDDFCVLACDGIWDVLNEQEAVDFVQERLQRGVPIDDIVQQMCDHCLADDSAGTGEGCDNMTAMVVVLKKLCTLKGVQIAGQKAQLGEAATKA